MMVLQSYFNANKNCPKVMVLIKFMIMRNKTSDMYYVYQPPNITFSM